MRYQYLFSREQMQTMTDKTRQSYEKNRKDNTPFFAFVLKTLYNRIKSDPIRYRAFGMYWWAVKAIFIEHGLDFGIANFGQDTDNQIKELYCGTTDEQTLVIADSFWWDMYESYAKGNNEYELDNQGGIYILRDDEMESLIMER